MIDITIAMPAASDPLGHFASVFDGAEIEVLAAGLDAKDRRSLHVLVEDDQAVRRALDNSEFEITDVAAVNVVTLSGRADEIGEIWSLLDDSGITVKAYYPYRDLKESPSVVLVTSDPQATRKVLDSLT